MAYVRYDDISVHESGFCCKEELFMALLTTEQIDEVWRDIMTAAGQYADRTGNVSAFGDANKNDVRQAIVDIDALFDSNQVAMNNRLSAAVKTARPKAKMFLYEQTLKKRREVT